MCTSIRCGQPIRFVYQIIAIWQSTIQNGKKNAKGSMRSLKEMWENIAPGENAFVGVLLSAAWTWAFKAAAVKPTGIFSNRTTLNTHFQIQWVSKKVYCKATSCRCLLKLPLASARPDLQVFSFPLEWSSIIKVVIFDGQLPPQDPNDKFMENTKTAKLIWMTPSQGYDKTLCSRVSMRHLRNPRMTKQVKQSPT